MFFYYLFQDFKHNLEYARNIISTMQLEPKSRQQLQLLLQRQHLEEEELRLRHYMELEKFQKNLDSGECKCRIFSTQQQLYSKSGRSQFIL